MAPAEKIERSDVRISGSGFGAELRTDLLMCAVTRRRGRRGSREPFLDRRYDSFVKAIWGRGPNVIAETNSQGRKL